MTFEILTFVKSIILIEKIIYNKRYVENVCVPGAAVLVNLLDLRKS
jgi:hypothetical protein